MTRLAFFALVVLGVASPAYALYRVSNEGTWPNTWPKELEPLRKQARTLVGPQVEDRHFAIPFTKREEFEAAWPHLLTVTTKGASIRLVRGPNFFLGGGKAGVVVHAPPAPRAGAPAAPEGETYIELIVDGDVVDLNRIRLPADTPINDDRFKDDKK
jgi:hypothetical protein